MESPSPLPQETFSLRLEELIICWNNFAAARAKRGLLVAQPYAPVGREKIRLRLFLSTTPFKGGGGEITSHRFLYNNNT